MLAFCHPAVRRCTLAIALGAAATLPLPAAAQPDHAADPPPAAMQHAGHAAHAVHAQYMGGADAHQHVNLGSQPGADRPAEDIVVRFADVPLVDQHERRRRLGADVVGDRIVVMDFVYTSCTTVCPVVSAIMGELQAKLGERVGRDVALVSVTVDPVRDTPARLREYARAHGAGPGWAWLTGSSSAVNETLRGLGTWTPDFEDHPIVMMVGDGRTGKWKRYYGFADPAALLAQVDTLTAARATANRE